MFYVFADYFEAARRNLDCITTGLVTNPNVAEKCFATEIPRIETKTPLVHQLTVPSDYATQPAHIPMSLSNISQ